MWGNARPYKSANPSLILDQHRKHIVRSSWREHWKLHLGHCNHKSSSRRNQPHDVIFRNLPMWRPPVTDDAFKVFHQYPYFNPRKQNPKLITNELGNFPIRAERCVWLKPILIRRNDQDQNLIVCMKGIRKMMHEMSNRLASGVLDGWPYFDCYAVQIVSLD